MEAAAAADSKVYYPESQKHIENPESFALAKYRHHFFRLQQADLEAMEQPGLETANKQVHPSVAASTGKFMELTGVSTRVLKWVKTTSGMSCLSDGSPPGL